MKKISFLLILLIAVQISYGQGEWKWSTHFESNGDLYPSSNIVMDIQVDENNNVYHCGQYDSNPLVIQDSTLQNNGNWDAFVSKFDENGNLLWINRIYSINRDEAASMVIADGFIYVAGSYRDVLNFSGTTATVSHDNNYDIYLAKYDLDGNFIKGTQLFYGSDVERLKGMTYDPYNKELVFTGFFKTEISYSDGSLVNVPVASGGKDIFFAKADTSGTITTFASAHTMQSDNGTVLKDINVSPDTSYYVTGDLFDTLVFPGFPDDTLFGESTSQVLILKLDKNLNLEWTRTGGGTGSDHANSATSDGFGNVYVAGKVEGTVRFDISDSEQTEDITGNLGSDLFIAKYNTSGNLLWLNRKGGNGNDDAFGIDLYQNIVQFCGNYADTLIVNEDTLTSSGVSDINTGFAIFDTKGREIGARGIGGDGEDVGRALSFDNEGNTVIAGYFTSTSLDINGVTYTNNSSPLRDGFLASYYYPFIVTVSQESDILCAKDSTVKLIGNTYFGQPPYNYAWSSNVTDFTDSAAYNLPAGSYTLTVTDSRDSVAVVSYEIVEPGALSVQFDSTNLSCYQSGDGTITTTVAGGTAPYSYAWVGASGYTPNSKDQSGLSAGKFYVQITDDNGCQLTDSVQITQPEKITTSAVVGEESPGGSDGTIDLSVMGGTTPYSFNWDFEGAPYPGSSANLTGLSEGLYTAHVVDDSLCAYDTNIVVPGVALRVVMNGTNISCWKAGDGSLSAIVASGYDAAGGMTYNYDFRDETYTTIASGADSVLTGLEPGKYYIVLTESPTMETSVDSITISEPDSIQITFDTIDASCYGQTTTIGTSISGGTQEYSYSWSNGATSQSLIGIPAGKYFLTVTDANACETIDSTTTNQPDEIIVDIIESSSITCYGYVDGQLEADVSGGVSPYSYQWNDNGRQTTYFAKLLPVGTYEVQVTDSNGCVKYQSQELSGPPLLQLNSLDTANISCIGIADGLFGVEMQGGTLPWSYNWAFGVAGDTSHAIDLYPGIYTVEVSDANGCGDSIYTFEVKSPAEPLTIAEDAGAHVDNGCYNGSEGSFTVIASGGWGNYEYSVNQIDWFPSEVFTDLNSKVHTVSVSDHGGCIETEEITITEPAELLIQSAVPSGSSIQVAAVGGVTPYRYSLDKTTWQTSNTFTDLAAGDYIVYLTDANSCGPDSSDAVTIVTSIDEVESAIAKIYPNPTKGELYVEFDNAVNGEFKVEVFSLTGIQVHQETRMVYSGEKHPVTINLSEHPRGIYLLKVNGIVLTSKIIVE